MDEHRGHGNGRHGRNGVSTVFEDGVGEDPLHAVGGAVANPEAFGDARA